MSQEISSSVLTNTETSTLPSTLVEDSLQNPEIFLKIAENLKVQELNALMQVNQQMKLNSQEHFRQKLQSLGQLTPAEFEASTTTNYWKIYSEIYNREVLFTNISQQPIDKQAIEELKVHSQQKHQSLSHIGIKKFSIGTKFSAFLSLENTLYFCKTAEYFERANDATFTFQIRENVIKFSTTPRNFIFLTQSGEVSIVFYNDENPSGELDQITLEWTKQVPVKYFKASNALVAFIINEDDKQCPLNSAYLNKLVSGQKDIVSPSIEGAPSLNDTKLNAIVLSLNDLKIEDANSAESNKYLMKRVSECPFSSVNSFTIGYSQLLLVSSENKLFSVDLSNFQNIGGASPNVIPAKLFEPLAKKLISRVFSGFSSFFAYEREEVQPLENWSTEQVIELFTSIEEFQDYINIIKYEGITGADLAACNKKFMIDRLGMLREDLILKLQTEIIRYKEVSFKKEQLYGWGKNDQGQLALSKCSNVNIPTKIDIPTLAANDHIQIIKIGWKNSVIVTKERRIFISENREKKAEKKQQVDEEEEKQDNSNNKQSNKKQKRKQSGQNEEPQPEVLHKNKKVSKIAVTQQEEQLKFKWIEVTHKFLSLKDKRKYKIIEVSLAKDTLSILGNCYDNKKLAQLNQGDKQFEKQDKSSSDEEEKKKLTPALEVLNRIKWDPALDQTQFTVVYQDRFLKEMEMNFESFDISEVKTYRVRQIKRLNKIVWDRDNKFEDLSEQK